MNEPDFCEHGVCEDHVCPLQVHMLFSGNCANGLGYPARNYLLRHQPGE